MRLSIAFLLAASIALVPAPASAENPFVSVPQVDPSGPGTAAADLQALATGTADQANALALLVPDAMLERCDVAGTTPGEVPDCEGAFFVADQAAAFVFIARDAGLEGIAIVLSNGPGAVPAVEAVVVTKAGEAADVVAATRDTIAPAVTGSLTVLVGALRGGVCDLETGSGPTPDPSCGEETAIGNAVAAVEAIHGAALALLVEVHAGPACGDAVALIESLGGQPAPVSCDDLPTGSTIVALLPGP